MKIKLTYSEVKQALKSGFVSPLNSAKKTVNFIGKCFYKLDVFSDDDAVDTTKIFEVIDQGPGVPAELRDKIFERFFRIERMRSREEGGTGLGLSIVRHIAQTHSGEAWVEDAPGGGAIFKILLSNSER